ncbi:glycosyltransferase [Salinisphaera aquimarina]|uniref:Glycosyltransferase n=1 Tax=Salinisphaera aquimarina TaxID=2094031 RepID=A0ABV7ESX3_9GAMM
MLKTTHPPVVALYHEHLRGGGATQVVLHLIDGLRAAGYAVELIVNDGAGDYATRVPADVRVVILSRSSQTLTRAYMLRAAGTDTDLLRRSVFVSRRQLDKLCYLPGLTRYLKKRRPSLLISNLWQLAITALSARAIAAPDTRVVCVFHSAYFQKCAQSHANAKRPRKWQRFFAYCQRVYARADALVTVSRGIANDLTTTLDLPAALVRTIYNPVVATDTLEAAPARPAHRWFEHHECPVVIAVGRLSPEKNYDALLQAFAASRERRKTRLLILGEGHGRAELERRVAALNLNGAVDLLGWVEEPAAFIWHADLFVLTSRWEGLSNGLIEALAGGCPIVAYDCPHGPREILDGGRYGTLVPLDNIAALASAIDQALDQPRDADRLRRRARDFSIEAGVSSYVALVDTLLGTAAPRH